MTIIRCLKVAEFILAICIPCSVSFAQQCVDAERENTAFKFYNNCSNTVIIKYWSDLIGDGVLGPLRPGAQEMSAAPSTHRVRYHWCDYDEWVSGSCTLPDQF